MIHGSKDSSVPIKYSKKSFKKFLKQKRKKLIIVKNGDHSLSSSKCIKIIKKELVIVN